MSPEVGSVVLLMQGDAEGLIEAVPNGSEDCLSVSYSVDGHLHICSLIAPSLVPVEERIEARLVLIAVRQILSHYVAQHLCKVVACYLELGLANEGLPIDDLGVQVGDVVRPIELK